MKSCKLDTGKFKNSDGILLIYVRSTSTGMAEGVRMKTALVTGGTGFVGGHLAAYLVEKGISVRCLVRPTSNKRWLNGLDVEMISGDLRDEASLIKAVSNVDVIFHLAGETASFSEDVYYQSNVVGTVKLLKSTIQVNPQIKRFVFVSSLAAAGPSKTLKPNIEADTAHPISPYGASKLAAEEAVLAFASQIPVTVIRPPVIYGPRDRNFLEYIRIVNHGIRPFVGWQDRYGSFIYIDDLVRGVVLAAQLEKASGQVYYLVSESRISWREMGRIVASRLKKSSVFFQIPFFIAWLLVIGREIVERSQNRPSFVNLQKVREFRQRFWICDRYKALKDLEFKPQISISEGLDKTIAWYRKEGWL